MKLNLSAFSRANTAQSNTAVGQSPVSSTIDSLPPTDHATVIRDGLLEWQVEGVITLTNALRFNGGALDASDTGTGKTYVAAATMRQLSAVRDREVPFGVVCPKSVITSWERVCDDIGVEPQFVLNYEALKGGKRQWLALDDKGEYRWNVPSGFVLIFDEAHRCKGTTSQNAKMMASARSQGIPVLACSATAATNPLEMRALGFVLGLHKFYNFWNWCRLHGCRDGQYGGLEFNRDERILLGIHRQIFPNRGTRTRIKDLGDRFPESLITAEAYNLGDNAKKVEDAYDHMEAEIAKLDERTANYQASVFAIMMEARMRAELLKIPTLVEMAEDALDEGMSVAVFLNFNDSIAAFTSKLKTPHSLIIGGQDGDVRQRNIDDFQADRKRVIVANIAAGGVGVSLHDLNGNFPRMSLISPNYSAIQLVQAVGRVWRSGGKSKSIQHVVFAAGTIEEQACRSVRSKLRNLSALNDGDLKAGLSI